VLTLDLPPVPSSAGEARRAVREYLGGECPDEVVDNAALLVTELVTNAVLHAGTDIVVAIDRKPGRVVVRVCDDSEAPLVRREHEPTAATGRGLWLVDRLATSWGVNEVPKGKEVWCEIRYSEKGAE
jgi:anti-sigma regulatory factor (Ser/Thr protein kinase)